MARLVSDAGIASRRRRPFKPQTTDAKHWVTIAENIMARDFVRTAPDQAGVADITYVPITEGWLHLAALPDCHSRRVVGWSM